MGCRVENRWDASRSDSSPWLNTTRNSGRGSKNIDWALTEDDGVARRQPGVWVSTRIQSSMTPTESASSAAPGLGKVLSRCALTSTAWLFPSGVPSDTRMTMLVRLAYGL